MATVAPSRILRRNATDRIATQLKQKTFPTRTLAGSEFQEPPLPVDPGQIEPPILTSGPPAPPPASDYWTRLDPGRGTIAPTISIDPSQGSGLFPGGGSTQFPTVGPAGPFPGGNMGGPQGSIYGYNPVTGNPIYNVTGSPRPGFFDSPTGRFVRGVGSTALNAFVPGAGFAAGKVFDAVRRANERRNTGTDLSGRMSTSTGQSAGPSSPAWFQPGYRLPAGIQAAIARGDYQTAYGASPQSIAAGKIAASQGYGGAPNRTGSFASEGRFLMDAEGAPRMQGPMYGDRRNQFRMSQTSGGPTPYASNQAAVSQWLMQQPAYIKFMQGRGG